MFFGFKRVFFTLVFTVAAIMIISSGTMRADVLIEPDNDFWRRNTDKMQSEVHNYYANGQAGYVTFFFEPGSAREVFTMQNGEVAYVIYTYTDTSGLVWGIVEKNTGNANNTDWRSGWVPMSDLDVIYDGIIFYNEFKNDLIQRAFNVQDYYTEGDLVLWSWPGSGEISWTVEGSLISSGELPVDLGGDSIYLDSDGREWGFVPYLYGTRNVWVCLSDLSSTDIHAVNAAPEPQLHTAADSSDPSQNPVTPQADEPARRLSTPMMAISLVSLVAMLSLVLISLLRDRKNKSKD